MQIIKKLFNSPKGKSFDGWLGDRSWWIHNFFRSLSSPSASKQSEAISDADKNGEYLSEIWHRHSVLVGIDTVSLFWRTHTTNPFALWLIAFASSDFVSTFSTSRWAEPRKNPDKQKLREKLMGISPIRRLLTSKKTKNLPCSRMTFRLCLRGRGKCLSS